MLLFIIYYLISPIIFILLLIISLFNKKIQTVLKTQKKSVQGIKSKLKTNKKKIIIHAASAGEYEQIKPLLKVIDKNIYFTIITCMSPTIYQTIKKDNLSDTCCYHPFDFPWNPRFFFKTINPSIYLTTRHDIWPIHLYFAKKMKIKTIIINANLYKNSIRLKWYAINFTKYIFNLFNLIIVPSEKIKNIFNSKLYIKNTHVISDTRFNQILSRKKSSEKIIKLESIKEKNNIIFGSISWEDLKVLSIEILDICDHLIIVPHEIDMKLINQIEQKFSNYSSIKLSEINNNINAKIIIIDKIGILPELYKYTKIAYVGGGFGKGVHSTIEPLVYNNIVCYGPNIDLLDEAKQMYEKQFGFIIENNKDLIENIIKPHFFNEAKIKENHKNIEQYLIEKETSTKKMAELINEYI